MSKCVNCGTNFVTIPEQPMPDQLCKFCQIEIYRAALREIQDRCQITGLTFEAQSYQNTETASKALRYPNSHDL